MSDPVVKKAAIPVLGRVTRAASLLGSALVLLLMLLAGADVLGRNFLGRPVAGVPEMVSLSIIVIVFLQAPQALIAGRWTRSDILITRLQGIRPLLARGLNDLFDLAGMAVFGVIVWGTWPLLAKAWSRSEFVGAVGDFTAPVWPVRLTVLVGAVLMILTFASRIAGRHRRTET